MAMYVFQEIAPKTFYFTYCLQEIGNYIGFLEDSENNPTGLISKWNDTEYGYEKRISSDFSNEVEIVDTRSLFIINNLKATFHYCFSQYKLFNNIEEEVNLSPTYFVRKHSEGQVKNNCGANGKYTARLYINDSFTDGEISIPGRPKFKPEAGSIIIGPSDMQIDAEPAHGNSRYIAIGHWV
jgi:hypothetical protein